MFHQNDQRSYNDMRQSQYGLEFSGNDVAHCNRKRICLEPRDLFRYETNQWMRGYLPTTL